MSKDISKLEDHNIGFRVNGLNHLGLIVENIAVAKKWFIEALGLRVIEDRGELIFLLAGEDVIAIKTPHMAVSKPEHGAESAIDFGKKAGWQTLDHYGFYAEKPEEVDQFATHVQKYGAQIIKGPYDRRDGRSVYFRDPLGNVGEFLYFKKPEGK